MIIEKGKFYRIPEVCDHLRISKATIYRFIKTRKLKAIRLGGVFIIPGESILALLDEGDAEEFFRKYI